MKKYYLFILFFAMLISMNWTCKVYDIDSLMKEYDKIDFTPLLDRCIYYRSGGLSTNSSVYFLGITKLNCGPYAVEVNNTTHEVIRIDKEMVIDSKCSVMLDDLEIKNGMKEFFKFNFSFIKVDEYGDAYFWVKDKKVARITSDKVEKDESKHIKGNWYYW